MKVCILTSTFHPLVGGAETYAKTMATGLADAGHEVVVVTDDQRHLRQDREADDHGSQTVSAEIPGVEICRLDTLGALFHARTKVLWEQMSFGLLPDLAALVGDVDLIHANCHEGALLASMVGLDRALPVVATFHDQAPEDGPMGAGRSRLVYRHLPIDRFIVPSRFYAQKALSFGAQSSRVQVVYLGIDVKRFRPGDQAAARAALGITGRGPLVVCAATLKPRKGLRPLVRAFAEVHRHRPDTRLLIAGAADLFSRDYADALRADIDRWNLDQAVRVDEGLSHDDMPLVFQAGDIVVQPSLAEGLGLALLEGMATGLPALGTDITGISEIIESGVNGLLVPPDDPPALAEALLDILGRPDLADRLRHAGFATATDRFSHDRMVAATIKSYHEVRLAKTGVR
ncbi:glycosyltransferase family 4 protein [Frankia sp. Cppng1_Ct_nod]|uniref:glycosyltransferase family 4 protein n=1 Tax=Frankia sp. Cppng1_Ct_nod TaxID=2897162 RepID=UPI001041ADC5|nr:glycosyltransferase family 4 protein [Frankia sp. Cppng1_Ct_nod]